MFASFLKASCLLVFSFMVFNYQAQAQSGLEISLADGAFQSLAAGAGTEVNLAWAVTNAGKAESTEARIRVFLTKMDEAGVLASNRRFGTPRPARRTYRWWYKQDEKEPLSGGFPVFEGTVGPLRAGGSKAFEERVNLPRGIEAGRWYFHIVLVPGPDALANRSDPVVQIIPVEIGAWQAESVTLDFEGIPEGLVPYDYYAAFGIQIQNVTALTAADLGGSGNYCSVHNGSTSAGFMPRLTAGGGVRTIINMDDGFSEISMSYAQSEATQGGFHIWSGPNGTGTKEYTYFFFPDNANGAQTTCSYSVWFTTGTIGFPGQSIEFFENDNAIDQSWFLVDNITFTPSRNQIVVHDDPIIPYEGESAGHTFGVSLSEPIPTGKSITLKLVRESSSSSGESLAVKGTSSVTFTSSSWNTPKPLTIWAPENDGDIANQVREFRLYRSSGSSPQTVPDRLLSVTEIDDDFRLTVGVLQSANHGDVTPEFSERTYDFTDDAWFDLLFTATPDTGYRFSEWAVSYSGVNNDVLFQLFGQAQNPAQIEQLVLDSGGETTIAIHAAFDEIGPVTVTMFHDGGGTTRLNGQIVGDHQTYQIEPALNVPLSATPAPGYVFSGWTSDPSGVILNTLAANTAINTTTDTEVTARFTIAPATLTVLHNGNGSTAINGQPVAPGSTIGVAQGLNVSIHAEPDPEWQFTGWSTNPAGLVGEPANPDSSLVTNGDATLTANFGYVGTRLTVQSGAHGTTDPNGTQYVNAGDSLFIEVFPEEGYKFKAWDVGEGSPEIVPVYSNPNRFYVTVNDPTSMTATFEPKTPAKLLIRATNLQNSVEVFEFREMEGMIQELLFIKQEGGTANTFKLEFFNEGDLPLVIETVTLEDRFGPLPSLSGSGFCLMQTPDFDSIDCQFQQPLSNDPLPAAGEANPPTLYLDFGREPGFSDLPNPVEDYYVGSFAYFLDQTQTGTAVVFDVQGIVQGGADVANISVDKIEPGPRFPVPNGGIAPVGAVGGGTTTYFNFEITNSDTINPFFGDKVVVNSNDGVGIDPSEFGFSFEDTASLTVPESGSVAFSMILKTKAIETGEPNVTYTGNVSLGTGDNLYEFAIEAEADGTSVIVIALTDFGGGATGYQEVTDNDFYRVQPDAPESGSLYEFRVRNPSTQYPVEVSNLQVVPVSAAMDGFTIATSQSQVPGTIPPDEFKSFKVLLSGPADDIVYISTLSFDYRRPGGTFKTFTLTLQGKIGAEHIAVYDGQSLPNFDGIQLQPSSVGQTIAQNLEVRHTGPAGSPALVGTIGQDIGQGFSVDQPSFSLQPGEVHAFTVDFTGPAPGDYEGIVTITSNDPVASTFVVNLTGTVFEPDSPPSQVPDFVARIDGELIGDLTIYHNDPLVQFTWSEPQSPAGIDLYHVIIQPLGGPWLYGQNYPWPATAGGIQTADLDFGTTYSVHIRAKDINGLWGNFIHGGSFTVTAPGPPSQVPNFQGRIGGQSLDGLLIDDRNPAIDFTWSHADSPIGIQSYQIVVQPVGGPWLYSQVVPYPALTHTLQAANLVPGTTYSIHIRAKDTGDVWGPFVNGGSFTVEEAPPPSPVPDFIGRIDGQNIDGLDVYVTNPVVNFSWSHATSPEGIDAYHVVLQSTSGGGFLYSEFLLFPQQTHTIATSGLEVGKSYSIHIRARDSLGVWGPYVNGGVFHVTTPPPPGQVPGFVGRIDGQNIVGLTVHTTNPAVDFTWNHATSVLGIASYQLVIQSTSGGGFLYAPIVAFPATSHTIQTANLEFGKSYSIHIRAKDTQGTWGPYFDGGAFAVEAPAAPGPVPNFVGRINGQNISGLEINITDPVVQFTWSHASATLGIERYHVVIQPTDGSGFLYSQNVFYPAASHQIPTSGLVYGLSYSIHIRARDTGGTWGPYVNGGVFSVVAPVPSTVSNFQGTWNGQNLAGLSIANTGPLLNFTWNHVSDPTGIERYHVVVKPADESVWLYSPNVLFPDATLSIQTSGLVPGKSYTFHIRAKNTLGNWGPFINGGTFTIQ